ncbi:MAG TPA: gliding motility lipoprotein GldD [Mariniphaga sp.]|nr:gliding motility lipoprotein GldD [Mariniphaga sp.]
MVCLSFSIFLLSCKESYTPKPRGYFRIDFPEKQYHPIENEFPYQFEIPQYATIRPDLRNPGQPSWINIEFPANKAEVHISYYSILQDKNKNREHLAELLEETRELAYKHSVKANAIEEQLYLNPDDDVYGILYRIDGNVASPMQFFLTDSTTHFLRGALYIRATPDIDSLKPVVDFLEKDVVYLIESTKWE